MVFTVTHTHTHSVHKFKHHLTLSPKNQESFDYVGATSSLCLIRATRIGGRDLVMATRACSLCLMSKSINEADPPL